KILFQKLIERENDTSTVIRKGLAIPHIIVQGENIFKILLVRAKTGIIFPSDQIVHIAFVLAGSPDQRNLHLKVLAAIAQITQDTEFDKKWLGAANLNELKNAVLLAKRHRDKHF
ncbi:MAG: PTS sugar transporter subunit IIA, partial [Candidatus Omnitrophica bacterium]|nr:PTS sugar transporter subunit IIA [Candidatus Omnitrophota bacterium]